MKRLFRTAVLLFLAAAFSAEVTASDITFENVCNQLAVNKITKGNFVQTKTMNSAKGKRELKSSGEFIFSLEGIVWKTEKPFPSTMVVGKTSIIQIAKDGTKKVTDTSDNKVFASVAETLIAVFSNDYSQLVKLFDVTFNSADGSSWKAVLVPKDSTISSVLGSLELTGTNATLESIVMTEASGNTTSYAISNHSYPKDLSPDEKNLFSTK